MDIKQRSDQWDIRINLASTRHHEELVEICKRLFNNGLARYIHITSIEIGDNPSLPQFREQHCHIALVLHNHTTKQSIIKKFAIYKTSWYIEPRDKTKSIDGWIAYHSKPRTKLDPDVPFMFQAGTLPGKRRGPKEVAESKEETKKFKYDQWERRKYLMRNMLWEQLDVEFPGFVYSSAGQSMKRDVLKQSNIGCKVLDGPLKNFIIWGPSGTGKSSSIALLYPRCYKKQKGSQYWDGYDKNDPDHKTVWIDECSKETLKTLTGKQDGGFEFLKELADRFPVTVDEKYTKGFKIRPERIIITMNEHPTSLLPDRAIEVNKKALYRKFKILHVDDWLSLNGLMCTKDGCVYDQDFISQFPKIP